MASCPDRGDTRAGAGPSVSGADRTRPRARLGPDCSGRRRARRRRRGLRQRGGGGRQVPAGGRDGDRRPRRPACRSSSAARCRPTSRCRSARSPRRCCPTSATRACPISRSCRRSGPRSVGCCRSGGRPARRPTNRSSCSPRASYVSSPRWPASPPCSWCSRTSTGRTRRRCPCWSTSSTRSAPSPCSVSRRCGRRRRARRCACCRGCRQPGRRPSWSSTRSRPTTSAG